MRKLCKIALILLLTSCSSSKMIELGNKASSEGMAVCRRAVEIYTTLSDQTELDKSQQDKIKILTNPDPAGMALPDVKVQDFSAAFSARINAYKSLMNTYQAFGLLTDSKYSDRTAEAVGALQNSYNAIEKLPDLPTDVSSKLPAVSKMITQALQAKQIKVHNEVLYLLSQVYLALWNAEEKTWDEYIDRIYNDYASGLNTVDSKKYDVKQISQLSNEPYSDEAIIILMYRLSKRDEIIKQRNALKKELHDFGEALTILTKIHSGIAKEKTDVTDVTSAIESINVLLKQK